MRRHVVAIPSSAHVALTSFVLDWFLSLRQATRRCAACRWMPSTAAIATAHGFFHMHLFICGAAARHCVCSSRVLGTIVHSAHEWSASIPSEAAALFAASQLLVPPLVHAGTCALCNWKVRASPAAPSWAWAVPAACSCRWVGCRMLRPCRSGVPTLLGPGSMLQEPSVGWLHTPGDAPGGAQPASACKCAQSAGGRRRRRCPR